MKEESSLGDRERKDGTLKREMAKTQDKSLRIEVGGLQYSYSKGKVFFNCNQGLLLPQFSIVLQRDKAVSGIDRYKFAFLSICFRYPVDQMEFEKSDTCFERCEKLGDRYLLGHIAHIHINS